MMGSLHAACHCSLAICTSQIVIRQFNQSIATREQRITTVEEKLKKMKDDEQVRYVFDDCDAR